MFVAILCFDANWPFCKGYSLCMVAIFADFQNRLIFRILGVFSIVFWKEQRWCACGVVFRMFLAILFFDANWPFCKGYSLCIVAIFADFQNRLIFRILGVFSSVFWKEQLFCASGVVLRMFMAILIFEPNWAFCKGYSLSLRSGHFSNFPNRPIFRILAVFSIHLLHKTNVMCL